MENKKYVEISDLDIWYFRNLILKGVALEINAGDKIGILGKNGTGKTTLIETIMSITSAHYNGNITYYHGIENNIKSVLQEYQYDRGLSLVGLYKLYCSLNLTPVRKDLKEMFSEYGLDGLLRKHYHKLSGGQKQKFKLMMCLELKPKLIILDEITTSLDFLWRQEILLIINQYLFKNPEAALVIVSHDYNELKVLTDTQYVIEDKSLQKVDDLDELFASYKAQLSNL